MFVYHHKMFYILTKMDHLIKTNSFTFKFYLTLYILLFFIPLGHYDNHLTK